MYSEITENKVKTWIIMIVFVLFVGLLGWLFSLYEHAPSLTFAVLIGAAVYALIMYFAGGSIALAVNGAREVKNKSENPRLWNIVENLAITDGLPMPRVYIMDDPAPNAFATGRNPKKAAVCATTGILEIMNDTELEGVFAHELGHVKNYDIRVSMIAMALAVVVSFIADAMFRMMWFRDNREENNNPLIVVFAVVGAILAPLVASMIQLAVSRRREYLADATGALTTRYPEGLASALEKIKNYGRPLKKQNTATAHLFFANPLKSGTFSNLFSTHPPIDERIRRLREMGSHA